LQGPFIFRVAVFGRPYFFPVGVILFCLSRYNCQMPSTFYFAFFEEPFFVLWVLIRKNPKNFV
jgi:hypothetical protein